MADDNAVEIRFSAATDDALSGIERIRAALGGLTAPIGGVETSVGRLKGTFATALPADALSQAVEDFNALGSGAARSALEIKEIGAEIGILRQGLVEKKVLFAAEASQFQITQEQKFALLEAETQREYDAELALLQREAALGDLSVYQRAGILNKIAALEARHRTDMLRLDAQAIAEEQREWTYFLSTIEMAFNSQLRGLLSGQESWSQALKRMLGEMIIRWIEMCEEMVVQWAAAQVAETTAATTGAAARAAADQAGADAGFLANIAQAIKNIMVDAGQAFAGVFAFLAPVMGPAAAGPAAAAQASVMGAAVFNVGTDYVVRGGLALIHPGETVIPAARGSGPFTGAGTAPQVHAPVSISVSALDSQSVKRFFDDNSHHLLRAINDAVKRGAHVGLRRGV